VSVNVRKSFELLLDYAMKNHAWECSCVEGGRIKDNMPCSCGATEHNRDILNAIAVIRQADTLPIIKWEVGVESPIFKYEGYA